MKATDKIYPQIQEQIIIKDNHTQIRISTLIPNSYHASKEAHCEVSFKGSDSAEIIKHLSTCYQKLIKEIYRIQK